MANLHFKFNINVNIFLDTPPPPKKKRILNMPWFGGNWHDKQRRTVEASSNTSVGKAVRLPSATAAVHMTIAL